MFESVRLAAVTLAAGRPRVAARELFYAGLDLVPNLRPAYERRRFPQRMPADRRASVVVEGYLGSANTWAAQVLHLANPGCRVAHHQHRPAEVKEGVRLGLPTLVLVRRPVDAIASILVRQPDRLPRPELARYIDFYARCQPLIDSVVVATFDQVTGDIDTVIDRLNARFGAHFRSLRDLGPEGPAIVRADIAASDRAGIGTDAAVRGAVPAEARAERLAQQRDRVRSAGHPKLLSRCNELFETFRDAAM